MTDLTRCSLSHFFYQLLQKDNKSRITLVEVMQHPWIKENMVHPGRGTYVTSK